MKHRLTHRAADDLRAIHDYIARDISDRARSALQGIYQSILRLETFPRIGVLRPELGSGIRVTPSGNYLVFYSELDTGVLVVRVLHASRDFESEFNDTSP